MSEQSKTSHRGHPVISRLTRPRQRGGKECRTKYVYDALNRLTSATVNGNSISLVYDGDGNRVKKTVNNAVTTYCLVDDRNPSGYAQVMEEYVAPNSYQSPVLNRVYNYGLALISQQQFDTNTLLPNTLSYYGFDGHGSVRFLTDTNGTITDTYTYDAFGTLIASNGVPQSVYLYAGQQFDSDLGLYYNRARYLNPNTGRFWTMDTYAGNNEDPLSLHKYLYTADDPVDNDDPSGHDGETGAGGMSGIMDIGFTLFATILPATSTAATGIALEAAPKDYDSRLLTAAIFAESSTAHFGGENQDEKEAIAVTVMNQAFYAKLPPGSKQKHNYNTSFGDGTILSAIQHGCVAYMGSRWTQVANASDLLPQSQLESNLKLDWRKHFNLSVDIANLLFGYHAPLTIKALNNEAPIGFHSGKQIGIIPNPDREHIIGELGRHEFYGFDKGHEYQ